MIDFTDTADIVAPQLLGCLVTHNGVTIRLTEVEAYMGTNDPAAHTFNGMTARNAAMFGPPGRFYVYFSYGIHHNGNIVCAPEGEGQGCLMRGGEVVEGEALARERRQRPERAPIPHENLARGPGNLGQALGLRLDKRSPERGPEGQSLYVLNAAGREPAAADLPRAVQLANRALLLALLALLVKP